jgi:hypothetical protein
MAVKDYPTDEEIERWFSEVEKPADDGLLTIPPPVPSWGFLARTVYFRRVYYSPTEPFTWMAVLDHKGRRRYAGLVAWFVCPRGHQLRLDTSEIPISLEGEGVRAWSCSVCNARVPHPWKLANWRDL